MVVGIEAAVLDRRRNSRRNERAEKPRGPAIRCLGQGRKGEAFGGGGGGRHREVEAVRWRMDHPCTAEGRGRGRADEEERSEERREVEMVMGGIRERGGKKNCGGCCEKVGVKSFEGNGIINARHVAGERWRLRFSICTKEKRLRRERKIMDIWRIFWKNFEGEWNGIDGRSKECELMKK